jgi:general secretion pathway protein J
VKTRPSGFTLLELLVVITILSLIVVALTGGVQFASRAWETQERQIDRQGDLTAVQNVLRQMLISSHDFQGDAGSLGFVGSLPRALNRGGLFDIELKADYDRFVLQWRPHLKNQTVKPDPTTADLVTAIAALDFAYYQKDQNGNGAWSASLIDASKSPGLIRISLRLADGKQWPPLIVAPAIDSPPGAAAPGSAGNQPADGAAAADGQPSPGAPAGSNQ